MTIHLGGTLSASAVSEGAFRNRRLSREALSPEGGDERNAVWASILRVPLLGKVLGANLLLVVAAVVAHFVLPQTSASAQLVATLALSFAATAALVWLALRPIALIESTAHRVSQGDFAARVPTSPLADRSARRLSETMNRLLDRVQTDRARIQYLAGRSIRARDIERESVARELRDSFAQTVAAIGLQLAALRQPRMEPAAAQQLEQARLLVQQLTEEMRGVAETLYPGTLLEFGMENAIRALVRRLSRRSPIVVEIDATMFAVQLPSATGNAVYRAVDEALRNVEQHSHAKHARVVLRANGDATVEIEDDGRGFDMRSIDPLQAGLGLFSAQAVLALAGGELQISSAPGLGTRVVARVPIDTLTERS